MDLELANLGKEYWRNFERGIEKEWLLTNGIGGYASSTIIGANTRRYHGLLVASLNPPVNRHLILTKIDESIIINSSEKYNLYSYKTSNFTMDGYKNQQSFILDPLPTFRYSIKDILVQKKITMVYGENTTIIVYKVINGAKSLTLELAPLVNFRDYHHNSSRVHMNFRTREIKNGVAITPYNMDNKIYITSNSGYFKLLDDCWFMDMNYPIEQERGLESKEDHYIPGLFVVDIKPYEEKTITIVATMEEKSINISNGQYFIEQEELRINNLLKKTECRDKFFRTLVMAADQFIVERKSTNSKTILAGYPWFTDWGRDTMIALPGLTLVTRRFDDAKDILSSFARYVKDGIVPNMFPDTGQQPAYNTVDASLWYFEAVSKYIEFTGDYDFIKEKIYETLKEIINSYKKGTCFNIGMDSDYLLNAGNPHTQLTWMDAMAGGAAVTPRHGKPVEINALWYNAFVVMTKLSTKFDNQNEYYEKMAEKIKENFEITFWNEEEQCLYDVVNKDYKDNKIRPNQILAVSLSNAVIKGQKARLIVQKVWEELYTSYGIRSLSKKSKEYKGIYIGNSYERDSSYHQGTAWSWLSGQFIMGLLKSYDWSIEAREKANLLIEPFKNHIYDGCIGSISEIFDGDDTGIPRGCFAQAWSVGEILQAYHAKDLYYSTKL